MTEKCGFLFNRHKWREWGDGYRYVRLCEKCGRMERRHNGDPWMEIDNLREFKGRLGRIESSIEEETVTKMEERKKALEWLKK